jgi:hypothetical protein
LLGAAPLENVKRWLDKSGPGGIILFQWDRGFAKDRLGRMPPAWLNNPPTFCESSLFDPLTIQRKLARLPRQILA